MNTIKKLMTLLLLLLAANTAMAQDYEYVPFVREGVKWVYYYDNPDYWMSDEDNFIPYGEYYYTFEIKGDTIINGKSYKPVHLYSGNGINEENDTVPVFLREENKVVYGIIPDERRYWECPIGISTAVFNLRLVSSIETGKEFILYDFNDLETFYKNYDATGSYYDCPLLYEGFSASTDTVLIGNQLRKRLVIHSPYSSEDYFIEGIGYAGYSPGMPLNYFCGITMGEYQVIYRLSHVIEDGEIIYKTEWYKDSELDDYEYVPFVREGVKWVYCIDDYNYHKDFYINPACGNSTGYRTLELKGDSVINGKIYKALHLYSGESIDVENDTIAVFLREEEKKVYGIIPDGVSYDHCSIYNYWDGFFDNTWRYWYNGEEFLLYDFQDPVAQWENLINYIDIGHDYNRYIHLFTDKIPLGNKLAKRYVGMTWTKYETIEGVGLIGFDCTPFRLFSPLFADLHPEIYDLEKVVEDGVIIYPQNYVENKYMPLIREGVKWVNERVIVNNGDTTCYYYTYEFKGNHPVTGTFGMTRKALYRYEGLNHQLDIEHDSIAAGMRENESKIYYFNNEPLNEVINQGRDMIDFERMSHIYDYGEDSNYGNYLLYGMSTPVSGGLFSKYCYIDFQREPFLNDDNFVKADPIMIDGFPCSRLAYIGENGDTLAYVIEGIGFDSRDMGDLLTPFTRKPDPNADYQEWCGLSHVIKDGKIIYKGMRYRPDISGDVNGDGEVTIADANSVIDVVVMGGNSGHTRIPAADVNGDGEINIADINAIIDIILSRNSTRE